MPSSQLTYNPHLIINKRKTVLVFFNRQCSSALNWFTTHTINCPAALFCSLTIASEHRECLWLCCAVCGEQGISRRAAFTAPASPHFRLCDTEQLSTLQWWYPQQSSPEAPQILHYTPRLSVTWESSKQWAHNLNLLCLRQNSNGDLVNFLM